MDTNEVAVTVPNFTRRGVNFRELPRLSDTQRVCLEWDTIVEGESRVKVDGTVFIDLTLLALAEFDWRDMIAEHCARQAWHSVNGEREERERREKHTRWLQVSLVSSV